MFEFPGHGLSHFIHRFDDVGNSGGTIEFFVQPANDGLLFELPHYVHRYQAIGVLPDKDRVIPGMLDFVVGRAKGIQGAQKPAFVGTVVTSMYQT